MKNWCLLQAEGQGHKQAILKAMMEGGQKEIMELVEILMVKVRLYVLTYVAT